MAGCDKAGRTKNSSAQKAYNMAKRWEINKAKRIARHKKNMAHTCLSRGDTRSSLRIMWVRDCQITENGVTRYKKTFQEWKASQ